MSIELGTVQTVTGKVDPARKLKCTTAAHVSVPKGGIRKPKQMYFYHLIHLFRKNRITHDL